MGGAVLARWLTQLHQQYPNLQIDLRSGLDEFALRELLRTDAADIALACDTEAERWVEHHRWTDTYRLVVPQRDEGTAASLAQALGAGPYLAFTHCGDHRLRAHLESLDISIRTAARIDHIDVLLSLVAQGGGCAIVPTSMLPAQLGSLRALPRLPAVSRRISLLARPRSLQSAAVRLIVDALAGCAL